MRASRLAVVLMLAGCFGPSERQRRSGAAPAGGTGGSVEPEADAAGGAGSADDAGASGGMGGSQAGPDARDVPRDAAPGLDLPLDTGTVRDAATAADAPRDAAADARPDLPRDLARDTVLPDAASPDTGSSLDGAGGDPEPGRLAGITRLHNQVRATIPVPPLTWDPALAATAASYATQCMFEHSNTPGVGENLAAFAPPGNRTAEAPVDGWADEKADYDYASNSCAPGTICGHYTQMVWKTSLRLGCAVQACSQGSPFTNAPNWELWVCQYSPPGNVVGRKPY
jgi:hypothetical protein